MFTVVRSTVRVNEARRSDARSLASGGVRERGTRLSTVARAPPPGIEPRVLFLKSAGGDGELAGGRRWPRRHFGQCKSRALPGLWAPSPSSCPPHQEKARAGKPTPTGLQIKDWQRWDSARVPCAGRPFSPCAKATPARPSTPTPFRKSPRPRPPRGLFPTVDRVLSHPQRDLSGRSRRRDARRCALASRGWRTQTSTNKRVVCKTMRELRGARGRPDPRRLRRGSS